MAFDNPLLSLARSVIDSVVGEIQKQAGNFESQALSVLETFVKDVTGGVWQGPDADKFVSDLNNMLPNVKDTHSFIGTFASSIVNAAEHIQQADQTAANQFSDVINEFGSIF